MSLKQHWLITLGIWLLWAYFFSIFFLDRTIFGFTLRFRYWLPIFFLSIGGLYWLIGWLCQLHLVSVPRLTNVALVSFITLMMMIAVDISYSVYQNLSANGANRKDRQQRLDSYRLTDRHVWWGELYPDLFYPTEKNFRLYKPNVTISGEHYGNFYLPGLIGLPDLMQSSTPAESVFQLKHVSIFIDQYGFRETSLPETADIFALGDSFTFGAGVDQGKSWVELLEQAIGKPIYNLGINGASPKQELMLLQYMLQTGSNSFHIRHLLWMIYEGNDLEDTYETVRPIQVKKKTALSDLLAGTVVEYFFVIPSVIQEESVLTKFAKGKITIASPRKNWGQTNPYTPVAYRSSTHGYRLFIPYETTLATKPESYILDHPHRPLLDQVFKDMASLAKQFGFKVTVLIAPTASRLYAPYFDNFPPVTDEPYFINYVADLSHQVGFDTINLFVLMQPYIEKELLYFRDDTHWDDRGNEVATEIIAKSIFGNEWIAKH